MRPARKTSVVEELLAKQLREAGLGQFVREQTFSPRGETWRFGRIMNPVGRKKWEWSRILLPRKWKFDFAFIEEKLVVEVEGGFGAGRHSRFSGFGNDAEKYNEAALCGWTVLRFDTSMVKEGVALDTVQRWMDSRELKG